LNDMSFKSLTSEEPNCLGDCAHTFAVTKRRWLPKPNST
jgi:hypothetical protein